VAVAPPPVRMPQASTRQGESLSAAAGRGASSPAHPGTRLANQAQKSQHARLVPASVSHVRGGNTGGPAVRARLSGTPGAAIQRATVLERYEPDWSPDVTQIDANWAAMVLAPPVLPNGSTVVCHQNKGNLYYDFEITTAGGQTTSAHINLQAKTNPAHVTYAWNKGGKWNYWYEVNSRHQLGDCPSRLMGKKQAAQLSAAPGIKTEIRSLLAAFYANT
jgi:hypothetical protein